jgi:hypothetical protein
MNILINHKCDFFCLFGFEISNSMQFSDGQQLCFILPLCDPSIAILSHKTNLVSLCPQSFLLDILLSLLHTSIIM